MDTREYRSQLQAVIREAYLVRLERYLDLVDQSSSPEDHRKSVELLAKLSDAFPATDEGKTLTTVQISIGGATFTAQPAQGTVIRQETAQLPVIDVPMVTEYVATPLMRASLGVNLDLEPLLLEK